MTWRSLALRRTGRRSRAWSDQRPRTGEDQEVSQGFHDVAEEQLGERGEA